MAAKRIPARNVVDVPAAALVTSDSEPSSNAMTVIPLVDGDEIAGLEIRCRCGSKVVLDCVYDSVPIDPVPPEAAPESAADVDEEVGE